jgi:hypothetical protein
VENGCRCPLAAAVGTFGFWHQRYRLNPREPMGNDACLPLGSH